MTRFLKLTLAVILIMALATPAWSRAVALPAPMPPHVTPMWSPAPGVPSVLYVPNIPGNLFRLRHQYYYLYGGQWYRGKTPVGPWHPVRKVPRGILNLPPAAFK